MDEYILPLGIIKCAKRTADENNCYRQFFIIMSRIWVSKKLVLKNRRGNYAVPECVVNNMILYMAKMDYLHAISIMIKCKSCDEIIERNYLIIFKAAVKTSDEKLVIAKMLLEQIKTVFLSSGLAISSISHIIAAANPGIIPYLASYFADEYKKTYIENFYNSDTIHIKNITNFLTCEKIDYNGNSLGKPKYTFGPRALSRIFAYKPCPVKIIAAIYDYKIHRSYFHRVFTNWPEVAEPFAQMYIANKKMEIETITRNIERVAKHFKLKDS